MTYYFKYIVDIIRKKGKFIEFKNREIDYLSNKKVLVF